MKATNDAATAGAASGEADSAVRGRPVMVQGSRPTSVVTQDQRRAIHMAIENMVREWGLSRSRSRCQAPTPPTMNVCIP